MPRIDAPVMLVGSVPLASAEEVLATTADALGDRVAALPDGETGYRRNWINYQAYFVHHPHPDIETVQRPGQSDGVLRWSPDSAEELWNFRVRSGVDTVEYGSLYYAEEALRSYVAFTDLRAAGRIAEGVRFQVCLPTPHDAICIFFRADGHDYYTVRDGYARAMGREIARILEVVPSGDLAIQWDVCTEVIDNEGAYPYLASPEQAWQRFVETLDAVAPLVPEDVLLGLHLCYGDLGGRHIVQPTDLALLTRMASESVAHFDRPIDWIHMPVPIDRDDDAYFAPLADLDVPDAQLFLGLIHPQDGMTGARRRLEAARRFTRARIGVATECGFGRRDPSTVRQLLALHRELADERLLQT